MNIIKHGSRGPAVEDIQRRLISLGYSLKKTGVDGVYLEDTEEAIRAFQQASGLEVTGEVDSFTWSLLVDSTFSFGDRMLYLRYPFFQGRDIATLQMALNSLGFTCGAIDGIFGTYTERAVIELQRNMDLAADGVVGQETFATLLGLKHVWEDKKVISHSAARAFSTHRNTVLSALRIVMRPLDEVSYQVARRIRNLAQASFEQARVSIEYKGEVTEVGADYPTKLTCAFDLEQHDEAHDALHPETTVAAVKTDLRLVELVQDREAFSSAVRQIVEEAPDEKFVIKIPANVLNKSSKQGFQNTAVYILDAVCGAYSSMTHSI